MFQSSGGALRTRVLEEFDEVNVLSDDANHRVLQAKWQDESVVLKEFNLKNDTDKACFMVSIEFCVILVCFYFISIFFKNHRMK